MGYSPCVRMGLFSALPLAGRIDGSGENRESMVWNLQPTWLSEAGQNDDELDPALARCENRGTNSIG